VWGTAQRQRRPLHLRLGRARLGPMHKLIQLTLDLFGPDPVAVPPVQAPDPVQTVQFAPENSTSLPTQSLTQVMKPALFRHPRSNREARLGALTVGFEFRRAKRRTIGFSVGPDGLVVSAPKWVPLAEVDAAVRDKSGWIVKKLDEVQQHQERLVSARIEWKEGASIPFMGNPVILVLDAGHDAGPGGAVLQTNADHPNLTLAGVPQLTLHLALPHHASPAQIRDAVQAWLMRQAKRVFLERLEHFAPRLGVQWRKLSLSSAGTRWGSASADGSIRLNWRLIHFRLPVIDYVVAHELSHLRVMDHSARFWDTVRTVVPDYAELRNQLKAEVLPGL
jgi:predicted metal-dependent hydrolase